MMRFLVFLLFILFAVAKREKNVVKLSPERTAEITQIIIKCVNETGVDPNVYKQIKDGTVKKDNKFAKFMYCASRQTEIANEDGTWITARAVRNFPAEVDCSEFISVMEECNKLKVDDPIETALKIFECFDENSPLIYNLF